MNISKITEELEKEFREASKITGKPYRNIATYYRMLCHSDILDPENCCSPIRLGADIMTEFEYDQYNKEQRETALAFTRDYIWFDEKK